MDNIHSKGAANKKPFYKKVWFWVIVVIVVIAIGAGAGSTTKQANETTKSADEQTTSNEETKADEKTAEPAKDDLTLDDGWSIDKSNPYATYVVGTVSNNTDKAINNYVQITFTSYDAAGATVGSCLANANNVDANGKWSFKALCSGENIETVKFKEITGF